MRASKPLGLATGLVMIWIAVTAQAPGKAPPGAWTLGQGTAGLSEARVASGGAALVMSCATYGGSSLPRYAIRLEGPVHGGRPLKAQLDVGPTHYNLELAPTASPTTSAWVARKPADERAYRALAARIRAANSPVKVKLGPGQAVIFPHAGAREVLGAQALKCLV